jgi:chemotaxis protein MotB
MKNDVLDDLEDQGSHRGGAWKVAYADFVTALMALFIVMWLLTTGKEVREAVGGYFRDPKGYRALSGTAHAGSGRSLALDVDSIGGLRQKLEQVMHNLPGFERFSKYVQFTVTGEGLRIELLEKEGGLFFETGNSQPSADGEQVLESLAQEIGGFANGVAIEGHTDARNFRNQSLDAYGNWELSFDRANMARRIMVAHGVRPAQIREIRGYGDRQALILADPSDSRNRRVSVVIMYEGR